MEKKTVYRLHHALDDAIMPANAEANDTMYKNMVITIGYSLCHDLSLSMVSRLDPPTSTVWSFSHR